MTDQSDETWQRIAAANRAAGAEAGWTVAQRDQMEALADDVNQELDRYPVIHAWRSKNGSQLQFWCKFCRDNHFHGRHGGNSEVSGPRSGSILPLRVWKRYLKKYADCRHRFGRGFCTCPAGSGDGHRAPHCWNRETGEYYRRGYILHEVEPNDSRALHKPKRT